MPSPNFKIFTPDKSPWMRETRTVLSLRGTWDPRIPLVMARNGITAFEADGLLGWQGGSIDFLKEIPYIRQLSLRPKGPIDISPIRQLRQLRNLKKTTENIRLIR